MSGPKIFLVMVGTGLVCQAVYLAVGWIIDLIRGKA